MSIYFEVRSSSKPDGEGDLLEPSRYSTREDAEKAAERESRLGFFSYVYKCTLSSLGCLDQYQCEYAAVKGAA